jgi:hypothetical protein
MLADECPNQVGCLSFEVHGSDMIPEVLRGSARAPAEDRAGKRPS